MLTQKSLTSLILVATGSVTVTVQDSCPNCGFGDLDLTLGAFNKIGDSNVGVGFVPRTWDWAEESGGGDSVSSAILTISAILPSSSPPSSSPIQILSMETTQPIKDLESRSYSLMGSLYQSFLYIWN
ncbi:1061_t:CDS:2 [Ambispora leptoticha]|uniref:1061_t:CDS:1 n=1 Tax=Ambispora leptoticha TaxID=144679 RepID=A0A9N9GM39_9GLOM|nr:1061_t:CDS:2 [Ambispora leptoticha]